jgi:hypothetical protein
MDTKRIGGVVGALLVLAILVWGLSLVAHPMSPAAIGKSPILGGTATSTTEYEYTEDVPYYTIDVLYPRKTPLSSPAADLAARTTIENAIAAGIAQFKQDGNFANLTPEDIQMQGLGPDRKYALAYTYKEYEGGNTVSEAFTIYEDTLGAHPNTFYRMFVFDKQGNVLTLEDLFIPGSQYLERLSSEAYTQVVAQLAQKTGAQPTPDMLNTARTGTEPSSDAFQFFYIDSDTLHLLFPPYQVAAYAAGSFDVAIPLSQLSDILNPDYQ